ncbi:hypothetical protein SEA_GHOBES_56 [Gordonia phage Ghobes]|uniref:Uncharacterized protein n=1 Tax=Gordonia phage Ghobes TaxID=1887647 RepID=A0A1B3B064_9CAUD|nr:hypothetical protein KCH37_gp56 [Gordonia phage Ghobes]AOE44407.1 hypothetical protein SEA_GHOBES_56 [Gordonia phage Ghobes]
MRAVSEEPRVFGGKGDDEGVVFVVQFTNKPTVTQDRYEVESHELRLSKGQALRLATRLVRQALLEGVGL